MATVTWTAGEFKQKDQIMKLENQVVSLELAKKLKALGVKNAVFSKSNES